MDLRELEENSKKEFDALVTHVIQSWEWGEFRRKLGLPLRRFGIFKKGRLTRAFQISFHKIPFTKSFVGYLPKGPLPDKEMSEALEIIGKKYKCAFIKIEPDIIASNKPFGVYPTFLPSPKALFTKYNFLLDLTPSENELFKNLHSKTRYNVRLAQRKGVKVEERTDDEALKIYLNLYFETTERQQYFGHSTQYHKTVWETLKKAGMARLLIASYEGEPLTAWMLLTFKDTLYYPYGGSSLKHKDVMSNNLVAWEAIRIGKKLKLKSFDMWGALGPEPDTSDPWYGFHRFKEGYGGKLVEYIGTFDLVFNSALYMAFTKIDKLTKVKVFLLKLIKK